MGQDHFLFIFSIKKSRIFHFNIFFLILLPLAIYFYKFFSFSLITYLFILQKKNIKFQLEKILRIFKEIRNKKKQRKIIFFLVSETYFKIFKKKI
jgi:hypothetical protein